jgi:hypothetical protein
MSIHAYQLTLLEELVPVQYPRRTTHRTARTERPVPLSVLPVCTCAGGREGLRMVVLLRWKG